MNRAILIAFLLHLCAVVGCSNYQVKYQPYLKSKMNPSGNCAIVSGNFDEAKQLLATAQLPHNAGRKRYEMLARAAWSLTSQLGSNDYAVIGEVYGGGNARSNLDGLKAELAKRAAQEGGEVIMVIREGIVDQPYTFSTPGYATTSYYGNTAYTTYSPGQTYSGISHFPQADAVVFKYVPGLYERVRARFSLSDSDLDRIEHSATALFQDPALTYEEAQAQLQEDFAEIQKNSTTQPSAIAH